jgi:hypothetical protein
MIILHMPLHIPAAGLRAEARDAQPEKIMAGSDAMAAARSRTSGPRTADADRG